MSFHPPSLLSSLSLSVSVSISFSFCHQYDFKIVTQEPNEALENMQNPICCQLNI